MIEGNLIEPIVLSAGCLKQKKKKIKRKKRERNIMESATEKDQHRLAMASYDERVKVDRNGRTRSASDSILPSKMKENDCPEEKEQTCVSRPFDSITDLSISGVPADHPVISRSRPSASLKNDGNGILLPSDSTQSQLQEEKIEGNLMEPIDLSADCLKQKKKKIKRKKRKREIMESATEKDQHRLATASYDERVKVEINECTRSASDSTLPSKVKENECSEQNDRLCVSKPIDSITDLGIAGVTEDHLVILSIKPSMSLENDGNYVLLPADVSAQSQLEEGKIEGNLTEPIDLSADCLKQKKNKIKRKKKRKRNIMESTTEKEQHRLAATSYDEGVKVDINESTRLASDSTLPSKVKEVESSEQKDQTSLSKTFHSIADLGIIGVPADHPVISSDGPSRSLKKKKTITSSETIPKEQLHQTSVAQPLHENKDLYLESECADLSTEERDFHSSNVPVQNRGPEEKVERTSTTCQSREACKHYPKDLCFPVAQPIAMPIWRGSFSIQDEKYDSIDLVIAHISNKACHKVYEVASQFQPVLHLEMCPKSDIWPKSFQTAEPNDDNIALYFFPSKISEQVFEQLVGEMIHKELAFRAIVQDAELLIFTSTELPLLYWTFRGKYYLWGVFRGNQRSPSNALSSKGEVAEILKMGKRCDDRNHISPLSNSTSSG